MRILPLLLMMPLSGCAIGVADSVICQRTAAPSDAHTAALIEDGGPKSLVTGQNLIAILDAGCGK